MPRKKKAQQGAQLPNMNYQAPQGFNYGSNQDYWNLINQQQTPPPIASYNSGAGMDTIQPQPSNNDYTRGLLNQQVDSQISPIPLGQNEVQGQSWVASNAGSIGSGIQQGVQIAGQAIDMIGDLRRSALMGGAALLNTFIDDNHNQRRQTPTLAYNRDAYGGQQFNNMFEAGGNISKSKAKKILEDGYIGGKKLTKRQKSFFGMIAGGGQAQSGGRAISYDFNGNPIEPIQDPGPAQQPYYGGVALQVGDPSSPETRGIGLYEPSPLLAQPQTPAQPETGGMSSESQSIDYLNQPRSLSFRNVVTATGQRALAPVFQGNWSSQAMRRFLDNNIPNDYGGIPVEKQQFQMSQSSDLARRQGQPFSPYMQSGGEVQYLPNTTTPVPYDRRIDGNRLALDGQRFRDSLNYFSILDGTPKVTPQEQNRLFDNYFDSQQRLQQYDRQQRTYDYDAYVDGLRLGLVPDDQRQSGGNVSYQVGQELELTDAEIKALKKQGYKIKVGK